MPVRCAIYARYSSDQQRPESIEDQVRHCRQEVARHPDRAALQKPRPFDLIVIDDTSRLSRNVVDSVQHFRELRFHGVDLYFVNQGLHSSRDNAEFLLAIYGAMDSEYIRELGRKTHRGLEGQVLKGLSAGGIAYGYCREPIFDPSLRDRDAAPRQRAAGSWLFVVPNRGGTTGFVRFT